MAPHVPAPRAPATGMAHRPPLATVTDLNVTLTPNGHSMPIGNAWYYPCQGCGAEHDSVAMERPCPTPYSDPKSMEGLLVEIRDLLVQLVKNTTPESTRRGSADLEGGPLAHNRAVMKAWEGR